MNRRREIRELLTLSILMFIVSIVLLAFGSPLFTSTDLKCTQLDTGWCVNYGQKHDQNVTLSAYHLDYLRTGDVLTISNTFDEGFLYSPTIMFRSTLSSVDVKIDNEMIYSFGKEYQGGHQLIPKKYNFVDLKTSDGTHTIEINYYIDENDAFRNISPIFIGNKGDLIRKILQQKRLSMFVGGFLCMYAIIQFCLGIYLILYHHKGASLFSSAAIAFLLGFYTYSYNDIFCFIKCHLTYAFS